MCAESLRCLEISFHMQDEIKLQVKKETLHVKIFIYEIFLTVILVYVSEQMFLHQYKINSVQNKTQYEINSVQNKLSTK